MASMKQIKKRKRSVDSTGKITKAMKLVATVKLQKTKQAATDAIPYFDSMYETISDMIRKSGNIKHRYLSGKEGAKKGVIIFSSNKGLAGSYNSNIVRKLFGEDSSYNFTKDNTLVYSIGAKLREEVKRRGFTVARDYSEGMEDVHYENITIMTREILDDFTEGKINEIYLVYTFFKNTISQIPRVLKLLPLSSIDNKEDEDTELLRKKTFEVAKSKYANDDKMPMNYELEDEEMLELTIPQYIASLLFGALTASLASESGARMTAMDNATKNAKELSDKLNVAYNRARQGAITQEITEIVGGANAI